MENRVTQRLANARERALSELKARGASRQKTLAENVRSVGVRGLVSGAVASARELLRAPDSNGRAAASPPPPPPPPQPILVDPITDHPIMRSESPSSFLWLDVEGYEAEIDRKRAAGLIDRQEAVLLREWAVNGYLVLRQCIPLELTERSLADVDAVWSERKHVQIDVLTDGRRAHVDEVDASVRSAPHKLNDLYLTSDAARQIFLHERIVRMVGLILGDEVVGCNSLTFEFGSQQPPHIDHVYMTPPAPRRLVASWIALEDVRPESGPLALWPGSHRLRPFDFGGTYHYLPALEPQHTRYVAEQAPRFPEMQYLAKRGDVLLWHALLVHGGSAIANPGRTRKSMACHYFARRDVGPAPHAPFGLAWYLEKPVAHSE